MRCAFCQNGDISTDKNNGEEMDPRTLAAMASALRREGCHNINRVGGEVVTAMEPAGQDLWAPFGARVSTVPLQSRSNASRFWIMLCSFGGVRAWDDRGRLTSGRAAQSVPTSCIATRSAPCQTGTENAMRPRPLLLRYASTVRRQNVPIRPCACPECRGRNHAGADAQ